MGIFHGKVLNCQKVSMKILSPSVGNPLILITFDPWQQSCICWVPIRVPSQLAPAGATWPLAMGEAKKNRWLVEIPRFSPASGGELQQMAQSPRSLNLSGGLPHFRPLFGELGCTKVDERNPAPRCKWNPEWVVDSFWMFLIFGWSKNGAYPINPHFWQ